MNRSYFNTFLWKPALVSAGIIEGRAAGGRYEASRDHGMHALTHFYASVPWTRGRASKPSTSATRIQVLPCARTRT
jgi:hypothetical protein